MTKKHFNALAEQLAAVRPANSIANDTELACWVTWMDSVLAIARACAGHNPAFDTKRFVAACRGE
jgi:hypothetical protein